MPAEFFGALRPDATPGEKLVYKALQTLPSDCYVFIEPEIVGRQETRVPDFVVVSRHWGATVLEVKDWRAEHLTAISSNQVRLYNDRISTSPVHQAREAGYRLNELFARMPDLIHFGGYHEGKISFPYRFAGILPFMNGKALVVIQERWGEGHVFGQSDLHADVFFRKLADIPAPFYSVMTERQLQVVCHLLDPARFQTINDPVTGEFKGIYDPEQVSVATEALKYPAAAPDPDTTQMMFPELEHMMPDDARDTALHARHVRLVRGVAGTGKTDVLVLRARYLNHQYPDLDILVTTFNEPLFEQRLKPELRDLPGVDVEKFMRLCARSHTQAHSRWLNVQQTMGLIMRMSTNYPFIQELGPDFVAQEIIWMKEMGRTTREAYVNGIREGRAVGSSGRRLGHRMKSQMFDLFEAYESQLHGLGQDTLDWTDLTNEVLHTLEQGFAPEKQYDVILVDEAQHFAPNWIAILKHFLKPDGTLFLCEDPSQSVYSYYSWKQKGLHVMGRRTRWLNTPYRNTRQIFEAAYALIGENELAKQLLQESGDDAMPNLTQDSMREGEVPRVALFSSWRAERDFISAEVERLIAEGVPPHQIGILHSAHHVIDRYKRLGNRGVKIYETRRQTGLEYRVVFIPAVQEMISPAYDALSEEDCSRQQLTFYMSMTRARETLYLSYEREWPAALEAVRPFVQWEEHISL